ncbi:mitochondrial fission ELM1 family protein [Marinobacterium sp. AK62]|uniref:Mitochondrial fission ELM1 family protein n=1 Tax=Marinobacterium alkalitolerans TaxID=1542925 RepID=A0ABS3Z662_9GAMM|nr:ELM1/GtrOC1 family putative glycosyltransferase [Marinobacterium alkalitolerans]MBP0047197.1 mitochondrial fission ELM1 family protein [Marinobacterium alkalitolerans]
MAIDMSLSVLVLDEGSPGHLAQSEGVVQLMRRQGLNLQVEQVRVNNCLPGILRGLLRALMSLPWFNNVGLYLTSRLERLPQCSPDLIISSGGKSAFASLALRRRYGARNVFVGVPEPFPDHWFDLIISPVKRPFGVPFLVSGLIPNPVTPKQVQAAGENYWQQEWPGAPCWSILIGGNSKSHHYSEHDWQSLVNGINELGKRLGIRWLITTSRRTPDEVEQLLADQVEPAVVAEMVLYNRKPKRVVQPFLAASERVLVTQDSLTMASEALCSGRPVTLLSPEVLKVKPGSFFAEMIEYFPCLEGVERTPLSCLPGYQPSVNSCKAVASLDSLGPELLEALKLIRTPQPH